MKTKPAVLCVLLSAAVLTVTTPAHGAPAIDGTIGGGEGWTLFTENPDAAPVLGGSTTTSDDTAETSQYHWWDGADHAFSTGPRGGVNNIYYAADANNLYIGVLAGTAPFNSWGDTGGNNDQGNLYIAIDTNPSSGTQLNANSGHSSYGGVKAVDFNGWQPKYIVGCQFVDNGGGGGGAANVEQTVSHTVTGGNSQGTAGAFQWNATSVGGGLANYEFKIAWSQLGFGSQPLGQQIRLAMYVTQNDAGWDAYDSGPGVGNNGPFEQIGDNPGDIDTGGLLGASDSFIPGSFPGSNHVTPGFQNADVNNDYNVVGHGDEIDTIEEYYQLTVVPEPSTFALVIIGGLGALSFGTVRAGKRREAGSRRG